MQARYLSRLLELASSINSRGLADISEWKTLINAFFHESGRLKLMLCHQCKPEKTRYFDVFREVLPRFFRILFESGMADFSLVPSKVRLYQLPQNICAIDSDVSIIMRYETVVVSFSGQLRASFSPSLKIIAIEVTVQQHQQYLSVPYLMTQESIAPSKIPVPVNEFGVPSAIMRYLETAQVTRDLKDLMSWANVFQQNPLLSLENFNPKQFAAHQVQVLRQDQTQQPPSHQPQSGHAATRYMLKRNQYFAAPGGGAPPHPSHIHSASAPPRTTRPEPIPSPPSRPPPTMHQPKAQPLNMPKQGFQLPPVNTPIDFSAPQSETGSLIGSPSDQMFQEGLNQPTPQYSSSLLSESSPNFLPSSNSEPALFDPFSDPFSLEAPDLPLPTPNTDFLDD